MNQQNKKNLIVGGKIFSLFVAGIAAAMTCSGVWNCTECGTTVKVAAVILSAFAIAGIAFFGKKFNNE